MYLDDADRVDLEVLHEEVEYVLCRVAFRRLRREHGVKPISEVDHIAFHSFEPEMNVFVPDVGLEEPPLKPHLVQPSSLFKEEYSLLEDPDSRAEALRETPVLDDGDQKQ